MTTSDPFELVGTIVDGRYRVDAVAGRGGYSVVYRAFHLSFESRIALKVLRLPEGLTMDRRHHHVGAFQREGKVLFELSLAHPSIVKAFEAGVVALFDGTVAPYLALEWLDGVSLDVELKYRRKHDLAPMTLAEVLSLLDEPAEGMALAHARGVVHRDIKPGNLFIARGKTESVVKILDFGIAKLLDDSMSTTTRLADTGPMSSFTPMYAAPEQWLRRLGATGTWTDVHAWALLCVELLVGKMPFMGDEAAQFMAACLDPELRPTPRKLGLDVPEAIDLVFSRGLALNPRDRYRDVDEFWRALRDAAQWSRDQAAPVSITALAATREEPPATPSPPLHRASPPGATTTRATASRSGQLPRRTNEPLRLVAALTLVGIAAILSLAAWVQSRRAVPTTSAAASLQAPAGEGAEVVTAARASPSIPETPVASESSPFTAPAATSTASLTGPPRPNTVSPIVPVHRAAPLVRGPDQGAQDGGLRAPAAPPITAGTHVPADASIAPGSATTLEQLLESDELSHRR